MKGFVIKSSTWAIKPTKSVCLKDVPFPLSFPIGGERYGVRPDIPTKARIGVDTEETSMWGMK